MTTKSKKFVKPTFGCDPEFFSAYRNKAGELCVLPPIVLRRDYEVPAVLHEDNPRHPIFKEYGDTLVHEDGAAFEMSTSPSKDWRVMWQRIHDAREMFSRDVLSLLPDVCEPELFAVPAMKYEVKRWKNEGVDFTEAVQFGCDPDIDIFDMATRCQIIDASRHPWRYGGGHIHFSGIKMIETHPFVAVQCMVMTAGLAGVAYSDSPDLDRERLFLYGKPGKCRIQNYPSGKVGAEYRTLSNRWTHSIEMAERVFTWAEVGLTYLLQGGLVNELVDEVMEEAKEAIINVDQAKALSLLSYIEGKV